MQECVNSKHQHTIDFQSATKQKIQQIQQQII